MREETDRPALRLVPALKQQVPAFILPDKCCIKAPPGSLAELLIRRNKRAEAPTAAWYFRRNPARQRARAQVCALEPVLTGGSAALYTTFA